MLTSLVVALPIAIRLAAFIRNAAFQWIEILLSTHLDISHFVGCRK